ncbi:chitinase [Corallococcus sp. M34]|nr:glycoside hydrolase family 18 protein [Citreicoccus inhibens]MBU8898884.1 chitinase [Citreicoccus inhibens]
MTWIYRDSMVSPWRDDTVAPHSLTNPQPVAAGRYSISVTLGPSQALVFSHPGLSTLNQTALVLRVDGGSGGGGALVRVRAQVNGAWTDGVLLGPTCVGGSIPANAWTSCRVPLTSLVPANATLTGIEFQETRGQTLPTLYFDEVGVEGKQGVFVSVSPASLTLQAGQTGQFTATVAGSTNTAVTWSVQEGAAGGAVTAAGLYTAPVTAGTYHVVATSQADPSKSASATVTVTPSSPGGKLWVSGYYTGWNVDLYPPEKVDFSALTHIIVGRVTPNADGTLNTKFDNDNGQQIARTLSTRAHAAGRKAIIMIGGSGEHDGWVGAAKAANRARFVQNLLNAMDTFGYDGLDIDWEPINPEDKPDLLALVQALRAARPNMLLTIPIGWVNANFPSDADPWFVNLVPLMDQLNVMSYEMIGVWDGWISWYTSALQGEAGNHPSSVKSSLEAWAGAGIPKAKLGMGIPFYGLAWRHITGPYQNFTNWSDYVGGDNSFTYEKISRFAPTGTYHWDDAAKASYLTFTTPVEDGTVRWITYDSPQAIAAKGAFARSQGYGGTIIWTLNQGCINPTTGANPLLDAVKGAFLP